MDLLAEVRGFLEWFAAKRPLLSRSPIVAAVSGGPDSLALLHALRQVLPPPRLVAAHLDHALRPGSEAEGVLVANAAAAWGLRCVVVRADVRTLAQVEGLTLEEAGRQARYRFLADVARQSGATSVATGHHADDQAESVLMHLIRGSGLTGLRGMEPAAPLPGAPDLWVVRPLLAVSRDDIEAYCHTSDLRPVHDATNRDSAFFRNRIRHELLPLLQSYNPQIKAGLVQMATLVAADEALLQEQTETVWEEVAREEREASLLLDRERWRAQPLAMRRRLLRRALTALEPGLTEVGFRTLEQARLVAEEGETGAVSQLPGGVVLQIAYAGILVAHTGAVPLPPGPQLAMPGAALPVPGQLELGNGWLLTAQVVETTAGAIVRNRDPGQAFVDVGGAEALTVRSRRPGERFRPLGLGGHSAKVKDVMINRKVPAGLRARWPLVTDGQGVVWLVGHQIDDRVRITADSRRVVRLRCYRPSGSL